MLRIATQTALCDFWFPKFIRISIYFLQENTSERKVTFTGSVVAVVRALTSFVLILSENESLLRETEMSYFTPGAAIFFSSDTFLSPMLLGMCLKQFNGSG